MSSTSSLNTTCNIQTLSSELDEKIGTEQRFSIEEIRNLCTQIACQISALHQKNLCLGTLRLEGIAKSGELLPQSILESGIGKEGGLATGPQKKEDQYQLAFVLFQLLAGTHTPGNSGRLSELRPNLPESMKKSLLKAMANNPDARFASVDQFAKAFCKSQTMAPTETNWIVLLGAAAIVIAGMAFFLIRNANSLSAKSSYARKLGEVERLGEVANALAKELIDQAKVSSEELDKWSREISQARENKKPIQQEYAQQRLAEVEERCKLAIRLGELWQSHREQDNWMSAAAGHFSAAKTAAEDSDFSGAMASLELAADSWGKMSTWKQNVVDALAVLPGVQQELQQREENLPLGCDFAYVFPRMLLEDIVRSLATGDAANAADELKALPDSFDRIESLLTKREEVVVLDKKMERFDQIQEARSQRQRVRELLSHVEEQMKQGQYETANTELDAVIVLLREVPKIGFSALLNASREAESAGRLDASQSLLDQLLSISYDQETEGLYRSEALLARAKLLASQGKWDLAAESCEQAIHGDGEMAEAYLVRAGIYNASSKFQLAISDAERAIELGLKSAAWNQLGYAKYRLGQFDAAMSDLKKSVEYDPSFADGWVNLGLVAADLDHRGEALEAFENALSLNPGAIDALSGRANLRRLEGQFEAAIRDCDSVLKISSSDVQSLVCRGAARLGLGELAASIEDLAQAVHLDDKSLEAHVFLATAHNAGKDYSKASLAAVRALELDASCVEAKLQNGIALHGLGKSIESISFLDESLQEFPNHVEARCCRGEAFLDRQDIQAAYTDFSSALMNDSQSVRALVGVAKVHVFNGNYQSAYDFVDRALGLDSSYLQARRTRAVAASKVGRFATAIEDCDMVLSKEPKAVEAFALRANARLELSEWQLAIDDCTAAIKLNSNLAPIYHTRATAYFKLGKKDEGTADYNEYLRLQGK